MRLVVQRVLEASVKVNEEIVGEIENGLLVYLGICKGDNEEDLNYLFDKIINLRIFEDENEKMNKSLLDNNYSILLVSQFTLAGDCRKGRRPNFMNAEEPSKANELFKIFYKKCIDKNIKVQKGVFREHMMIHSINDGPVTILLDSKKEF